MTASVTLMGLHDLSDLAGETVCATVIAVTPLGIEGHIVLCDCVHLVHLLCSHGINLAWGSDISHPERQEKSPNDHISDTFGCDLDHTDRPLDRTHVRTYWATPKTLGTKGLSTCEKPLYTKGFRDFRESL